MSSLPLQNYLLTNRKYLSLSQDEVAFLMGSESGTKISRYERMTTMPSLETALAYKAIFQKPIRELFEGLYENIEKEVVTRAEELVQKSSENNFGGKSGNARESLQKIITRHPNKKIL